MKNNNNTSLIATTILSSVIVGAVAGYFLFPKKRKKIITKLNRKTSIVTDVFKVKLYGIMEHLKNELELACDNATEYLQMEKALNAKILKITLRIQSEFPELYPYLEEMPITISNTNDPEINLSYLKKYYNSLENMLKNYIPTHQ